jgi:hypothetical protein
LCVSKSLGLEMVLHGASDISHLSSSLRNLSREQRQEASLPANWPAIF